MKKLFSVLLMLAMLTALCIPALAADMDEALAAVTLKVKEALDISDAYTDFSGSWDEWQKGSWYLNWSDDASSVSVTADADGKVLDYWRYEYGNESKFFYGFAPAFPAMAQDEAQTAAEKWADKLCGDGESAVIEGCYTDLSYQQYCYNGEIYINDLPSPITFSLTLGEDGTLQSYNRSDCYGGFAGEIPAYREQVSGTAPAEQLSDTVAMELYWVSDGEGSASLRYVPCSDCYVVTYPDGTLTDMDELYAEFNATGYGMSNGRGVPEMAATAEDASAGWTLTEAELAAVDAYADVMPEEKLDETLRAISQLGLNDGFTLCSSRYSQDSEGNVDCMLTYIKTMDDKQLYGYSMDSYLEALNWGDDMEIYKYIEMDAKTGEISSINTGYPLYEKEENKSGADTRAMDEAFLQTIVPEKLAQCEYCTLSAYEGLWAQVKDGYFFPENVLSVEINEASGTVDKYYVNWDNDIDFGKTKIIDEDEAKAAYKDGLTVAFGYVAWPVGVSDDPAYEGYADWGYDWVETLRLGWYYDGTEEIAAVDAVSGELVSAVDGSSEIYSYNDLNGCEEQTAIEKLGGAGIGISGGEFEPDAALDMRTAAKLLLQAAGSKAEKWDDVILGEQCRYYGMIEAGDWDPDKTLSRMDFIKMLLSASEYGKACTLYGVWSADFTDKAEIAKTDMGYAAVAQGLQMVTEGKLNGDAECTRAMAAYMLAAFMER